MAARCASAAGQERTEDHYRIKLARKVNIPQCVKAKEGLLANRSAHPPLHSAEHDEPAGQPCRPGNETRRAIRWKGWRTSSIWRYVAV
jgi:hypothetical protein